MHPAAVQKPNVLISLSQVGGGGGHELHVLSFKCLVTCQPFVEKTTVTLATAVSDKTSTCDWRPLLHTGTIALGLTEVAVAIEWHDQGWGNSKGTIKCVLMRASKVVMESSCGMAPHQQAMTNIELPAVAEASQPGDELQFLYQVRSDDAASGTLISCLLHPLRSAESG